jgi:hypothetical protein
MHSLRQYLLVAVMMLALFFSLSPVVTAGELAVAKTLDRDDDAVIIKGSNLSSFAAVSLNQLFVYAFKKNQWHQIPWQFDEKLNGQYCAVDNGTLDPDDELVVMGRDCGDRAAINEQIGDASARSFPRYEITVADPLNTSKLGWIYVYRSTTLADTVKTDYVVFDFPTSLFTTPVYKLGFMVKYLGGDRLELNGSGINVLDRSKYRFKPAGQDIFNEEWAEGEDPQPEILDGRVRAIAGYQEEGNGILTFAYRSSFYDLLTVDLMWAPGSFEWARASADFNENIKGGIYYDANTPAGVVVDGKPDSIKTTPASLWQQISASTGTVIHTADITPMQGTLTTFYKDDATLDPADTGDKMSFGDMGVTVAKPVKYIYLSVTHYILPPKQPNVGARYYSYFTHPLQAQASLTAVERIENKDIPQAFSLARNYPNPFNATTTIQYQLSEPGHVKISIYDVTGRKIRTLVDEEQRPGTFRTQWDGLNESAQPASSGIYLCELAAGPMRITRQLVLLK